MTNKTTAATLCALGGNAIFGFSFMFSRIALGIATPFVMLTYRFILAVIGLSVMAVWSVNRKNPPKDSEDFMRFDLRGKPVLPLICLGVVQPVAYFFCESYGIAMTNASFSGVIIALVPIVGLILGAVCLGERATGRQVVWSLVSIAGVIVMTLLQSAEGEIRPLGVLLLLGAVLLLSCRPLCLRFIKPKQTKTNIDAIIGKTALVTEEIDNAKECGEVRVGGLCWSARSAEGDILPVGVQVTVLAVDGVKLIVK